MNVVNALYIKIVLLKNVLCALIQIELQVWKRILLKRAAGVLNAATEPPCLYEYNEFNVNLLHACDNHGEGSG
jgi:hypothetical protein